jgi:hypothetical protein
MPSWDVFISHASEDKESFVRPLAEALTEAGVRVWYDEFELKWGDSLLRTIDEGLARSSLGIVVLSPRFFEKKWPKLELDGLVARELGDDALILPVWHEIEHAAVAEHSPILAGRIAKRSSDGLDVIVEAVNDALGRGASVAEQEKEPEAPAEPRGITALTLATLSVYARTYDDSRKDWGSHLSRPIYQSLRQLQVHTVEQLDEAITDEATRKTLSTLYARLLDRDPDSVGELTYLPYIFLLGSRGAALVEQDILASAEYRAKADQHA